MMSTCRVISWVVVKRYLVWSELKKLCQPLSLYSPPCVTSATRHTLSWVSSPLWAGHFILSGSSSNRPLLFPTSKYIRQLPTCGAYLSAFHTAHGVIHTRILEWVAICSPVDHILSELFTVTHLPWVALHGIAHNFAESHKPFAMTRV